MRGYKMEIRMYAFLLFLVGCWGLEWKAGNEFKDTFKEYWVATNVISSIENILNNSIIDSEEYLKKTFSDNPLWKRMAEMKLLSSRFESNDPKVLDEKCLERIIDEDNFKLSYQIQLYQIQVPLLSRVVDIRERLNNINSSLDIYHGLTESKYLSCKSVNGKCFEETNEWLLSTIGNLSCIIYSNCSNHSIKKRSTCSTDEFMCSNGECIPVSYFCNGKCDCHGCNDEPSDCVKNCSEFRCSFSFRCVPKTKLCNGINDCGDWSDEEGCPVPTVPPYLRVKCPFEEGDFLCNNSLCISLRQVCDSRNDCGDWSDEGGHCNGQKCSPECGKKGGVCFTQPMGSKCLYECPPGTYETVAGCSRNSEAPLPTLRNILEDSPRLVTRYAARLKYLKIKTIMALSESLRELLKCKKNEFNLLSKMIDFSTITHKERLLQN